MSIDHTKIKITYTNKKGETAVEFARDEPDADAKIVRLKAQGAHGFRKWCNAEPTMAPPRLDAESDIGTIAEQTAFAFATEIFDTPSTPTEATDTPSDPPWEGGGGEFGGGGSSGDY